MLKLTSVLVLATLLTLAYSEQTQEQQRVPTLRYQEIYNRQRAYQNYKPASSPNPRHVYDGYRNKWDSLFNKRINQKSGGFRHMQRKLSPVVQQQLKQRSSISQKGCGVIKPIVRRYVANGQPTTHVDWPWYTQLIIRTDAEAYCGGTIISENYILSAAHCYDGIPKSEMGRATSVMLKGVRVLNPKTNKYDDIEVRASDVYIHDQYVPAMTSSDARRLGVEPGPRNDLALIRIDIKDQEILKQITPACLPERHYQIPVGTRCKIMGHGFVNAQDEDAFIMPRLLQMADVFISRNDICQAEVDSEAIRSKINSNTLCIRGPIHPCVGDSGGPLVCKGEEPYRILGEKEYDNYDYGSQSDSEDSEWYLAGVTSFAVSTDLQDKCGYFKSAVFGKVANNLDWIARVTGLY